MNRRVIEVRKYKGLNQTDFAKKLGFTQANLSAIELGKIPLTETNIHLLCLTFGVREEWIRTGEGEMFNETKDISSCKQELFDTFDKLSPQMQEVIQEIAHTLLNAQS
jgi:transcriptional regulator with XRE-family HTH domain